MSDHKVSEQSKTIEAIKKLLNTPNKPNYLLLVKISYGKIDSKSSEGKHIRGELYRYMNQKGWNSANNTTSQFYYIRDDSDYTTFLSDRKLQMKEISTSLCDEGISGISYIISKPLVAGDPTCDTFDIDNIFKEQYNNPIGEISTLTISNPIDDIISDLTKIIKISGEHDSITKYLNKEAYPDIDSVSIKFIRDFKSELIECLGATLSKTIIEKLINYYINPYQ